MQKMLSRHLQGALLCILVPGMMIVASGCIEFSSRTHQEATTTLSAMQTPVIVPQPTATTPPATPTQPAAAPTPSSAFRPGIISFIGPVKSVNSGSLVMSGPDGRTYTMAITARTDRSDFDGNLPAVGIFIDVDAAINPDGSLTVTSLEHANDDDADDLNVIAYTGVTTSTVGADYVIHFTAGVKSYTYTIPATADLHSFGGNARAIGSNTMVKVKVQYPTNTIVSIRNLTA